MKNSKSSIEKLSLEILKQHHNKYTHKLNHLKLKNGIPIDTPNLNIHKKSSKTRRFVPRRKYQQWKKVEATKKNLGLIHNFSDINLSNGMISLLNKGPGFVPLEHTLNVTQTMADLNKYERRIRWCEYFSNEVTNLSDHIHDEHENLSMNNSIHYSSSLHAFVYRSICHKTNFIKQMILVMILFSAVELLYSAK